MTPLCLTWTACISVTCGFRGRDFLLSHGAGRLVDRPGELLTLMRGERELELDRLRDPADPRFKTAMSHYAASFPPHEQRRAGSQAAIMAEDAYYFYLLREGGEDVGALLCWQSGEFIYVEHFFIYSDCRGKGYGGRALTALGELGKVVILEIDPPVDEVARRREGFYLRCGFYPNPYPHVHPPYHRGKEGHTLVILSSPRPIGQGEYDRFNQYLQSRVMAGALD